MREVNAVFLKQPPKEARFAIMKTTAFGAIDIGEYYSKMSEVIERMIDLPYTQYRVYKIEGR